MSLSGYEAPEPDEQVTHEDTQQSQLYEEETEDDETVTGQTATPPRPSSAQEDDAESTMTLDSPSLGHSTPRAPPSTTKGKKSHEEEPQFAGLSSPYEALRQEMEDSKTPVLEPVTPGKTQFLPDMTGQLDSSPFVQPTTGKKSYAYQNDPLLHRVLDKTYRVQATPMVSPRKYKATGAFTPRTAQRGAPTPSGATARFPKWAEDSSPPSSPAPQLRADMFSPAKTPRTPGVSVQTPGKGRMPMSINRNDDIFDDSDDEEEHGLGFSPPKTIQFHIPQSKLLQTPGKFLTRPRIRLRANGLQRGKPAGASWMTCF